MIPELVTGVQFSKGPYFADQGDFATAGSTNINYATMLDRPIAHVEAGGQGFGRVLLAASPVVGSGHLLGAVEVAHDDGPWVNPDDYRKVNAVVRYSRGDAVNAWAVTGMAYHGEWNSTDQLAQRAIYGRPRQPVRGDRCVRRRPQLSVQRLVGLAARNGQHADEADGLRNRLRPAALLQLHVLPRRPRPRRPDRSGRSSLHHGREARAPPGHAVGRPFGAEHLRRPGAQRRHRERRPLSFTGARAPRDREPGVGR